MLINFFLLLLELLAEGAIIYFALWGLRKCVLYFAEKKNNIDRTMFYFDLFVVFSWIVYIIYCFYSFADEYFGFDYVAIVLVLLGYRFLMNIVLGVLYKIQKGYRIGLLIDVGGKRGSIYSYGSTSLVLESENKDLFSIPYVNVYTDIVIQPKLKNNFSMEVVEVCDKRCLNFKHNISFVKKQVLLLPEIAVTRGVDIKYFDGNDENNDLPVIKIEFGVVNVNDLEAVKMKIKDIILK